MKWYKPHPFRAVRCCLPALLFLLSLGMAHTAQAESSASTSPLAAEEIPQLPHIPQPLDLTAPTEDLWVRIRNGFSMPNLNDELVLKQQQYYQARPEYLRRMVERSSRYLHHIVEELERRGMPTELALLPMVESAYNPMAYSSANASGLWQFIPSTGKHFNLQQNWWHDQRRDIVASTSAALDYLQYVYEMHGDWHLALASYNWGEGAVGRAIAKNEAKGLPTDYLSLNMPSETRNYVPKLQALKNIFSNPRLVAELKLPVVPNEPYFRTIVTDTPIDLSLAAEFSGLTPEEFLALNPAHNRPVISAEATLVIPADRVDVFKAGLASHDQPLSNWQTYTLQPGEKLEQVATRFGMTLGTLKSVNGIKERQRTFPGQTLLVRGDGVTTLDADAFATLQKQPLTIAAPRLPNHRTKVHVVKKGETLQGIARIYKVSPQALKTLNKLKTSKLVAGTSLFLPVTDRAEGSNSASLRVAEARTESRKRPDQQGGNTDKARQKTKTSSQKITRHKVKKGDTLFALARRYNVEESDIRRWNKLAGNQLKIGSTITVQRADG